MLLFAGSGVLTDVPVPGKRAAISLAPAVVPTSSSYCCTGEAALQARQCPELLRSIDHLRGLKAESAGVAPLEEGARTLGCH